MARRKKSDAPGDYGRDEKAGEAEFNYAEAVALIQKIKDLVAQLEELVGLK